MRVGGVTKYQFTVSNDCFIHLLVSIQIDCNSRAVEELVVLSVLHDELFDPLTELDFKIIKNKVDF